MHTLLIFFQNGLGGLAQLLPIVLIIVIFYVLLIRPQQKRQRQLQETIASLKTGDRVITTGGIIGVITAVRDTSFMIRSADKTVVLKPPRVLTLELALEFIEDDELVEVTPDAIRLRKRLLTEADRHRADRAARV